MNADIYLKACDLAQAIAQSPEAQEIIETEQRIREDTVANKLTERWKKVYERIAELQQNGQPLTEEDERSIELIEAKVENHPLILEFINAHHKFTEMLEEINGILVSALVLDSNEETDGCVSCPSRGQCDIDAVSCDTKQ